MDVSVDVSVDESVDVSVDESLDVSVDSLLLEIVDVVLEVESGRVIASMVVSVAPDASVAWGEEKKECLYLKTTIA